MSVISDVKEVGNLVKQYNDIELNRKIVQLEGEVIELTRDNYEKTKRIDELEALLARQQELEFRPPFFYAQGDDTPFCPNCWEADRRQIHLEDFGETQVGHLVRCRTCKEDWYR